MSGGCGQANGAGVEILENKPASHPVMGDGVYTLKHYHIDRRFPGWLRAIAPKVTELLRRVMFGEKMRSLSLYSRVCGAPGSGVAAQVCASLTAFAAIAL